MADVTDKFEVKLWNGFYYCRVQFPDGASQELKSADDLDYKQWQEKITVAWDAHNTPEPEPSEADLREAVLKGIREAGVGGMDEDRIADSILVAIREIL